MFTLTLKGHFQIRPQIKANLTLDQCQRRRKCVKLYIIRLVLMEQGCLYYFVVTLDQKATATNQTNAPFEKVISNK